jgi:hypothetical protein
MSAIRVFASHDWGKDGANHTRVASVVASLRRRGIHVWFDETHMAGNIIDSMCKGIDEADVVLAFVTCNYMKKVEQGGDTDNVRREFMYASATPHKMLPIRFDANLPQTWSGPVRMILGARLYVDLSETVVADSQVDGLVDAIRRAVPRIMWRTAVARIPRTAAKRTPAKPIALRDRVQRLRDALGDTGGGHISDVVWRLADTLLSSECKDLPMTEKIARMERELCLTAAH